MHICRLTGLRDILVSKCKGLRTIDKAYTISSPYELSAQVSWKIHPHLFVSYFTKLAFILNSSYMQTFQPNITSNATLYACQWFINGTFKWMHTPHFAKGDNSDSCRPLSINSKSFLKCLPEREQIISFKSSPHWKRVISLEVLPLLLINWCMQTVTIQIKWLLSE